jgi:hypothetical protein
VDPVALFSQLHPDYQFYITVSLAAAAATAYLGNRWNAPGIVTGLMTFVSVWTAAATLNYAAGWIDPGNTIFLDWSLTTPALIAALGLKATDGSFDHLQTIVGAAALQLLVVLAGYQALALGSATWFFVGTGLFLLVQYLMLFSLGEHAGTQYQVLAALVFLAWLGYPYLFYQGILFDRLAEDTVRTGLVWMPILSKHVYGLVLLYLLRR